MARSVDQIQKAIITDVASQSELSTLTTNTSKRSIWRLWTWVTATAIALLEQLIDIFQTEVETTVSLSAPQTAQWVQDRVFKFQYSATTPQVIQLIDLIPQYTTIDTTLRIVTRCSVKSTVNNQVTIKVAKNTPPEPLLTAEVSALQNYIDTIGVAGIEYIVLSTDSDKIYIDADIFYVGSYSAIIQSNVITAIETYLSGIPFDGLVKVSDLEVVVRGVEGVNDIVINNIRARGNSTPFASGQYLVQNNALIGRTWATISGYIVGETTAGYTLTDSLTFIAE